jgi:hypothetical protein
MQHLPFEAEWHLNLTLTKLFKADLLETISKYSGQKASFGVDFHNRIFHIGFASKTTMPKQTEAALRRTGCACLDPADRDRKQARSLVKE